MFEEMYPQDHQLPIHPESQNRILGRFLDASSQMGSQSWRLAYHKIFALRPPAFRNLSYYHSSRVGSPTRTTSPRIIFYNVLIFTIHFLQR